MAVPDAYCRVLKATASRGDLVPADGVRNGTHNPFVLPNFILASKLFNKYACIGIPNAHPAVFMAAR